MTGSLVKPSPANCWLPQKKHRDFPRGDLRDRKNLKRGYDSRLFVGPAASMMSAGSPGSSCSAEAWCSSVTQRVGPVSAPGSRACWADLVCVEGNPRMKGIPQTTFSTNRVVWELLVRKSAARPSCTPRISIHATMSSESKTSGTSSCLGELHSMRIGTLLESNP